MAVKKMLSLGTKHKTNIPTNGLKKTPECTLFLMFVAHTSVPENIKHLLSLKLKLYMPSKVLIKCTVEKA